MPQGDSPDAIVVREVVCHNMVVSYSTSADSVTDSFLRIWRTEQHKRGMFSYSLWLGSLSAALSRDSFITTKPF